MSGLVWVGQEATVHSGDNGRGGSLYLEASHFTWEVGDPTKDFPVSSRQLGAVQA